MSIKTITKLKYLLAYYAYHHCEPQDFDDCGGMAQFLDDAANAIVDAMPTADIEKIRPFLIGGNVHEWIPLGQAIQEVMNPAPEDEDDQGMTRIQEEHDYKFGDWRL